MVRLKEAIESLAASVLWDLLKWAAPFLFAAVGAAMLRFNVQWLVLLALAALGGAFSVGAWALQRRWGVPLITVAWEEELGFIRGFRFHNHGPGPAVNVTVEPIQGNGYKATLEESIAVLVRDERSEIMIPKVLPIGDAEPVVENDIQAVLSDKWSPLIVRFEDAAQRIRRLSFEIKAFSPGFIQVRRKPRR